jgi:exonuclease SbcD
MRFVPVPTFLGAYIDVEVDGISSLAANSSLQERVSSAEPREKIVVLRVSGELASGKTSDIDLHMARKTLMEGGAIWVYVNRHGLTSREQTQVRVTGEDAATIERNLFNENSSKLKLSTSELVGERGADHAAELLRLLRQAQKPNEMKKDYAKRVVEAGTQALLAKDLMEGQV